MKQTEHPWGLMHWEPDFLRNKWCHCHWDIWVTVFKNYLFYRKIQTHTGKGCINIQYSLSQKFVFCPIIHFMYCVSLKLIIQVTYCGQSNICCVLIFFSVEIVFQWLLWWTYYHKRLKSQLFHIFYHYLHFASFQICDCVVYILKWSVSNRFYSV